MIDLNSTELIDLFDIKAIQKSGCRMEISKHINKGLVNFVNRAVEVKSKNRFKL